MHPSLSRVGRADRRSLGEADHVREPVSNADISEAMHASAEARLALPQAFSAPPRYDEVEGLHPTAPVHIMTLQLPQVPLEGLTRDRGM